MNKEIWNKLRNDHTPDIYNKISVGIEFEVYRIFQGTYREIKNELYSKLQKNYIVKYLKGHIVKCIMNYIENSK